MNKILKENKKKNEKSIHLKQIQNIMNKKRKAIETPSNNNSITFSKNNMNKLNKNTYQKNTKTAKSLQKVKKEIILIMIKLNYYYLLNLLILI